MVTKQQLVALLFNVPDEAIVQVMSKGGELNDLESLVFHNEFSEFCESEKAYEVGLLDRTVHVKGSWTAMNGWKL